MNVRVNILALGRRESDQNDVFELLQAHKATLFDHLIKTHQLPLLKANMYTLNLTASKYGSDVVIEKILLDFFNDNKI